MKAIIATKSGPPEVLKMREVEKPDPGDDEMLVRVHASSVTIGDAILRKMPRIVMGPVGMLFGFKMKKITGHEFAGTVEEAGKNIRSFKAGDQVFGTTTGFSFGANAEYVCIPEAWKSGMVAKKPSNLTFHEAAAVPIGAMTALQILRKGNIETRKRVLIYGASGSVGTYAVQIAKYHGADVTGVCSTGNLEMVSRIGADRVIDYTKEDFRKNGEKYDLIFDAVRKLGSGSCKGSLAVGGKFISSLTSTSEKNEDLIFIKDLIEKGKLKPVIDKVYPLDKVPEAHRYVEMGHKKGNVVISVMDENHDKMEWSG